MKKILLILIAILFLFPSVMLAQKPLAPMDKIVPYRSKYRCNGKWVHTSFQSNVEGSELSENNRGWICTKKKRKKRN